MYLKKITKKNCYHKITIKSGIENFEPRKNNFSNKEVHDGFDIMDFALNFQSKKKKKNTLEFHEQI